MAAGVGGARLPGLLAAALVRVADGAGVADAPVEVVAVLAVRVDAARRLALWPDHSWGASTSELVDSG